MGLAVGAPHRIVRGARALARLIFVRDGMGKDHMFGVAADMW
jgi:hypothetical protein